jgi:5-methylcytosine-specific restriction protein A
MGSWAAHKAKPKIKRKNNMTNNETQKAKPTPWTKEEMKASVKAYLKFAKADEKGESLNKRATYRALEEKFGRSSKSFEYRMQNISYVFELLGRPYVTGLKPAKNVGKNMIVEIKKIIADLEK